MMSESFITGRSPVYGIIGFPVSHSLSPVMQNAALQDGGIPGVYVPFEVLPDQLAAAVAGMRALQVKGFNVTIPHKTAIMSFLDKLDSSAVQAGAVNTVVNQEGCLIGYNTDGDGLVSSLQTDLGCTLDGVRIVLLGAGGAARGALAALCRAGAKEVLVVNRTLSAAAVLATTFSTLFPATVIEYTGFDLRMADALPRFDLVINATSLGMGGEKIEGLPLALLADHAKVYDMVYNPAETLFLQEARRLGRKAANGLGMLVAQGERAFSLWHGRLPGSGVMQRALESCLTHDYKILTAVDNAR